ncbi:MAG TPA: hypothetical protein VFS67_35660 [Polyangiaceae bacterium]|nr:hypothetical protein [Polyangiaceae bacterium]
MTTAAAARAAPRVLAARRQAPAARVPAAALVAARAALLRVLAAAALAQVAVLVLAAALAQVAVLVLAAALAATARTPAAEFQRERARKDCFSRASAAREPGWWFGARTFGNAMGAALQSTVMASGLVSGFE